MDYPFGADPTDVSLRQTTPSRSVMSSASVDENTQCFDLDSTEDTVELKIWSKNNWDRVVKKSIENLNPLVYHDCCFCFSRRGFSKNAGHPALESCSILKIPSLKDCKSADDLYKWLRQKIVEHSKQGRKTIFPAINRPHILALDQEEDTESEKVEVLAKRCKELSEEKEKVLETISKLTEDNQRLQRSSKTWYLKYQQALSREEEMEETRLDTPVKKKKTE